jgi:hypothetical protein
MTTRVESCHFEHSEKSFSSVFSKELAKVAKVLKDKIPYFVFFASSFEKRGPWSPSGGENPPFSLPGDERKIMNHFVAKTILF